MFFYVLWNYLIGYVVIRVEGLSLEKFINLTVSRGIHLWGIDRQNYTTLTAKISIKGFRQLHGISHKIRCRIRIVDKRGLPFILFRYRHRKMLAAGLILFLFIIYGLSSFVWTVEVEGAEEINPQKVLSELESLGVQAGVLKSDIDSLWIENQLIIRIPELSWASLEIRGSKAVLRVRESVLPPVLIDRDTPCNVVAAKDGIIDKMIVLDGQAMVSEGQTVKKGQLLISGIIEHPNTIGVRYVHSMGKIIARTWYEETVELSLKEPFRQRTGRRSEIRYIGWERFKVPYMKEEVPFLDFDLEVKQDGFFILEIYHETEEIYWERNKHKAKQMLEELANQKVRKKIPMGAKIVDKKLKYDMIGSEKLIAVIYAEALEDIGMQQDIAIH
ncbi:MAG TPA: sporulation protein YqfD [Clostridiales bacterium]|jgi:similar to stage IV sporulation protein|nr:sporulation protein YqfD [Clostridiales bacterium]